MSSGRRLVGWTLCLTLVLSAVAVGPAAADHSTSDDWEGEFDPAQHSTIVHYQYSTLLTHTFRCDTPTGCFFAGIAYSQGDTRERVCEFLGTQVSWEDCSDVVPGWALVSSVERQHDPPTWSLRFCSQSGWGQNPLGEAWGTTNGPIDAEGHRSDVGQIGDSMWSDTVPVNTSLHEPPFCGDWTRAAIRVSIADATVDEGGNASLTMTATGTGSGEVQFATADGSAVAGSDYDRQSGFHRFNGPGTRTVTIRTIDDDTVEGSETFTVSLSNPSGVDIGTGTATVNILDDDHPAPTACALTSGQTHRVRPDPGDLSQHDDVVDTDVVDLCVLSASSVTVPEDGGSAQVTFRLSGPAPRSLAGVAAAVETGSGDGAATAGDDFIAVDSTGLTFAAGATVSAPISVGVIDDTEEEPDERFAVVGNLPDLENGTAATTVTILDNDDPDDNNDNDDPDDGDNDDGDDGGGGGGGGGDGDGTDGTGRVYTGAGVTVTEGETATVRFTVAPPPAAGDPVSAAYATVGTALARPGEDFVAVSGTVTFTDAADTATVDVVTIDDDLVETLPDIVTVSVGLSGGDTVEAQITILDNDTANNNGDLPFEDPNPPLDRNCPTPGTHGHDNDDARGWYCHDDHGEPSGCADVVQVSTVTDHHSRSVGACNYQPICVVWDGGANYCWQPPEPPCPRSFHYHGGYCHDHNPIPDRPGDDPLDCLAGRAQQYITASHRTGTVKACPQPTTKKAGDAAALLSRLIVFAGEHLILRVEVDVASPHVLTRRRLRVVAVNGCDSNPAGPKCAQPGTHFEPLDSIVSFNPSTPQPVEIRLKTLIDLDHGTELRQLKFVISDDINPEMDPIKRSAWVEPPLRGTQ